MKSVFDISALKNNDALPEPITESGEYRLFQYEKALEELMMYKRYLANLDDDVSMEGATNGLLRVFIGVGDVFLRVCNTFKTNLIRFAKDMKRSEMRYYYDSHTLMCKSVEDTPITDVTKVTVPTPSGMKGTYMEGCLTVKNTYEALDLITYVEGVTSALKDIQYNMHNSKDYKSILVPLANIAKQRAGHMKHVVDDVNKRFTTQRTPMYVKFTDAYKTMSEFSGTRTSLLDMEPYLQKTSSLLGSIDSIDNTLAQITQYLSEDTEVNKAMISAMIDVVRYLAASFDLYGATSVRQMALEHNHIYSIERVWEALGKK